MLAIGDGTTMTDSPISVHPGSSMGPTIGFLLEEKISLTWAPLITRGVKKSGRYPAQYEASISALLRKTAPVGVFGVATIAEGGVQS